MRVSSGLVPELLLHGPPPFLSSFLSRPDVEWSEADTGDLGDGGESPVTPQNKTQPPIYTGVCHEQETSPDCGVRPPRLWMFVTEAR